MIYMCGGCSWVRWEWGYWEFSFKGSLSAVGTRGWGSGVLGTRGWGRLMGKWDFGMVYKLKRGLELMGWAILEVVKVGE